MRRVKLIRFFTVLSAMLAMACMAVMSVSAEVITGTADYIGVVTDVSDTIGSFMPTLLGAVGLIIAGMIGLGIGLRLVRRAAKTN